MTIDGSGSVLAEAWRSNDVAVWRNALQGYWQHRTVRQNLRVERYVDQLTPTDREAIVASGETLVEFLHDWYYSWKFSGVAPQSIPRYQQKVLTDYSDHPGKYDRVADGLRRLNPEKIEQCLKEVASAGIPGLQLSAGSGVLAVLFPMWFGVVDYHTLASLRTVDDARAEWLNQNIRNPRPFSRITTMTWAATPPN